MMLAGDQPGRSARLGPVRAATATAPRQPQVTVSQAAAEHHGEPRPEIQRAPRPSPKADPSGPVRPHVTEHQQYSTENQSGRDREWAAKRGCEIVRTYADDGKSGLKIEGVIP